MTWREQSLSGPNIWTLQADWGPSSMLKPFGDLWYLVGQCRLTLSNLRYCALNEALETKI